MLLAVHFLEHKATRMGPYELLKALLALYQQRLFEFSIYFLHSAHSVFQKRVRPDISLKAHTAGVTHIILFWSFTSSRFKG